MPSSSRLSSTTATRVPRTRGRALLDELHTAHHSDRDTPEALGEVVETLLVLQVLAEHGVPRDDAAQAARARVRPDDYLCAKSVGARHAEILHAWSAVDLATYARVRRHLAHADAVRAAQYCERDDVDPSQYGAARATGASHDEVVEAVAAGALDAYATARRCGRRWGITHDDALTIATNAGTRLDYPNALETGAAHSEILATLRAGLPLAVYGRAREEGLAHGDALAAMRAGVPAAEVSVGMAAGLSLSDSIEWVTLKHYLSRLTLAGYRAHVLPLTGVQRELLRGLAPTWAATQTALLRTVRHLAS